MTEQLQLDLAVMTADPAHRTTTVGQLTELPGTEWEHIFGLPAPGDAADAPISRSNATEDA